jgi:hypothetical protein
MCYSLLSIMVNITFKGLITIIHRFILHTFILLTLYPQGIAETLGIPPIHPHFTDDLPMRNTVDVTVSSLPFGHSASQL